MFTDAATNFNLCAQNNALQAVIACGSKNNVWMRRVSQNIIRCKIFTPPSPHSHYVDAYLHFHKVHILDYSNLMWISLNIRHEENTVFLLLGHINLTRTDSDGTNLHQGRSYVYRITCNPKHPCYSTDILNSLNITHRSGVWQWPKVVKTPFKNSRIRIQIQITTKT